VDSFFAKESLDLEKREEGRLRGEEQEVWFEAGGKDVSKFAM
jgi:hypothetical protein